MTTGFLQGALHLVARRYSVNTAGLLLDRRADIGAKNARGETVLSLTNVFGQKDVA